MKWTEEQRQAIELKNRRLLVSAAAGSGKTAVLTERIVRRISDAEDPVDVDELLVMTFTRAAAGEMRERIRKRLEERLNALSEEGGNGAFLSRLRRQAVLLDGAKITTIDSFCLSLIREHADRTELDPAFRVGGEEELGLMRADVMEELLESQYALGEPAFLRFAGSFSQGKTDRGLAELLFSIYDFSESTPWPDDWLSECIREAEGSASGLRDAAWMGYLLEESRRCGRELLEKVSEALQLCGEENGPAGYEDTFRLEQERLRRLAGAGDFEELQKALSAFSDWPRIGTNPRSADREKAKEAKRLRDFWKESVRKLCESFLQEDAAGLEEDLRGEAETIREAVRLVRLFRGRYAEKKRSRNLLDFSDLEHVALSLLWKKEGESYRKTELAASVAESFREIYVDEYQDSNAVQEALLSAIERGAVFLVGDVKQSIYAFRQARPELFAEKYRSYRPHRAEEPSAGGTDTRIDLSRNFRSRREVLDSVNQVFERLMDEAVGGISYDEAASLFPGAEYPYPGEERAGEAGSSYRTELLITEISAYDAEERQAETEAHLIAERIRKLTDPERGLRVLDAESGGLRPAELRDIVILLRSASGQAEIFAEVLMREGIPALAEQRTGYFDALEVKTVLSLLSAIDNPLQDIPLAAVLLSPIGGLGAGELAALLAEAKREESRREREDEAGESSKERETGKGQREGETAKRRLSLYERLSLVESSEESPEAAEKLRGVLSLLRSAAEQAVYLSLPELIRRTVEQSGYDAYVAALPGGEVRKANLDMLLVKAEDFERSGYRGLYDFVRYIELLKKYDTDYGEARAGADEASAVRIMTIHKSKGLEFPVVFLAGTGRRFNLRDAQAGIVADPELGLAADAVDLKLRVRGATLKKRAISRRLRTSALGEELRVLYVAMTRAKEKLIMTAAVRGAEELTQEISGAGAVDCARKAGAEEVRAAGNVLDWLLLAMSRSVSRCGIKWELCAPEALLSAEEKGGEGVRKLRGELLQLASGPAAPEGRALFRCVGAPYPHEEDVTLRVKRSVSELKLPGEERDGEAQEEGYLKWSAEPGGGGGAARGTACHRAMEKLDYGIAEAGGDADSRAGAFLDQLAESGALTAEERALVRGGELLRFLASPLGRRMASAWKRGKLHRESQFVMALPARELDPALRSEEPVLIQGVIDAWFEEDGKLVVVDYKTDRVRSGEELAKRYRRQLDYYARALGMTEQKEVAERLLWSFALGREISLSDA